MGAPSNYIGKTYNNLYALDQKSEGKHTYLYCRCTLCGTEKWIRTDHVVSGQVKSCGCTKTKAADRIGKTYGCYTILSVKRQNKETLAYCRCNLCQKEKWLSLQYVIHNKNLSCGCLKIKNIKGQKFGFLMPIEPTDKRAYGGSVVWKCLCEACNNECYIAEAALTLHDVQDCGCIAKSKRTDIGKENLKKVTKEANIFGTNILNIKSNKPRKDSITGIKGVGVYKGNLYRARITFQGKTYYLGTYSNLKDAVKARKIAEKNIYGKFLEWYYKEYKKGDNNVNGQ